jgi:hypothetical protein
MAAFFEQTWFLWWIVTIALIVRWFHVVKTVDEQDDLLWDALAPDPGNRESSAIPIS